MSVAGRCIKSCSDFITRVNEFGGSISRAIKARHLKWNRKNVILHAARLYRNMPWFCHWISKTRLNDKEVGDEEEL